MRVWVVSVRVWVVSVRVSEDEARVKVWSLTPSLYNLTFTITSTHLIYYTDHGVWVWGESGVMEDLYVEVVRESGREGVSFAYFIRVWQ